MEEGVKEDSPVRIEGQGKAWESWTGMLYDGTSFGEKLGWFGIEVNLGCGGT